MSLQPTVAIISPGDMGHAIGAVLWQHGLRVLTNLQGRSGRTASLAAQAGMADVADDQTLVREADILLSVLVPAHAYACAERIAAAVRATPTTPLFSDFNAISPPTVQPTYHAPREARATAVGVGIIGSPPPAAP